jgi:hypothetical protein
MDSQWRIAREDFSVFDPERELDDVLARIRSRKIALVLRYWNSLRRGSRLPRRAEIDPAAIKSALPSVMITSISYRPFRVLYRLVGTEIVQWARVDFTNRYADELIFDDSGRDWSTYYRAAVEARKPAYGLTDWLDQDRAPLWVELLICPLSEDGETIDRCLAVEDYEPMSDRDFAAIPPTGERRPWPVEKASE